MSKVLDAAKKERELLRSRLVAVERFIELYVAFEEGAPIRESKRRGGGAGTRGQSGKVARLIEAELFREGKPLRSRDLAARLSGAGIVCNDLSKYIPIIVHRNLNLFRRTPKGYALRMWDECLKASAESEAA